MIVIATTLIGSGYGAWLAQKRGGNRYDIAQYAAVMGILGGLLGLIVAIIIARTA